MFPASSSKMAARVTPSGPTPHKLKLDYSYISQPVVEGLTGDKLEWTQQRPADVAGTITKALLYLIPVVDYALKGL